MSKRALIIVADGFEEIEAVAVIDILRRAEIKVTIASIDFKLVTSARNLLIKADYLIDTLPDYEFDMLILPGGGLGVKNLQESDGVKSLIKRFNAEGKYIAAICAAPTILENMGLLKDKTVTAYPGVESDLKSCKYTSDNVVIDGKLITSKGPGTAMEFSFTLVELLRSKELRDTLETAMVFTR
jgi:4-methyl-5(b-hydroxyethyl)-thiazole monophosphate biosynthesis